MGGGNSKKAPVAGSQAPEAPASGVTPNLGLPKAAVSAATPEKKAGSGSSHGPQPGKAGVNRATAGSPQTVAPPERPPKEASEEADSGQALSLFFQAFKASPVDGWIRIKAGDTVSVYRNQNQGGKLPYMTTLVRCEFPVMAPADEAQRHFLDITERTQRDFFFKEGKLVSFNGKDRKVIAAQMRTLSGGEAGVQIVQTVHTDDKGNHSIVEVPGDVKGKGYGLFFFPSYWIQNLSPTSCTVIALYRFDFERACPKQADFSDGESGTFLQDRFNKYAEPLAHSLFLLGGGGMAPLPSRRSPQNSPTPARRNAEPSPDVRPQPQVDVEAMPPRKSSKDDGQGELIVGGKFKWKKGELIGHGSIGKVYMGLDFETGEMMAVKQVDLGQQLGPQAAEELKAMDQEILIFSKISHPNIVRYYGMEKDENQLSIFLEFVSGGSIASMLRKFGSFSEQMIANFTAQIVDGLDYLHQQQICHRDIKAANILYSNEGIVKLADFGTAKKIADVMNMSTGLKSLVGTPYMMAPEVIRQTGHGMPADIWSLACVIWEMATCKPPFTQFTDRIVAMYNIAHATKPPDPPTVLSDAAQDFVKKCMLIDAKARATTRSLLQHHFVASVVRKTVATPMGTSNAGAGLRFPSASEAASMDSVARSEFVNSHKAIVEEEEEEEDLPRGGRSKSQRKGSGKSPGMDMGLGGKYMDDDDDDRDVGKAGRGKPVKKGGAHSRAPMSPSNNKVKYDLTDSDESGDEHDGPKLSSTVPKKSPGGVAKYQGELSEDGLTRAQAEAMGRPFVPAMGSKGPSALKGFGLREERTDSEDSSGDDVRRPHMHKRPPNKSAAVFSESDSD